MFMVGGSYSPTAVGPFKVKFKASCELASMNYTTYLKTAGNRKPGLESVISTQRTDVLRTQPFFAYFESALLQALPDIGQLKKVGTNGLYAKKDWYLINYIGSPFYQGPSITVNGKVLQTLTFSFTIEFNGILMENLILNNRGNVGLNGYTFDTRDAFNLAKQTLLEQANSQLQGWINAEGSLAVKNGDPDLALLLSSIVIPPGGMSVGSSIFGFPSSTPTAFPTEMPTEEPTPAPSRPLHTGFSLAAGFAFIMTFSLTAFCYLQYCPGYIPYRNFFMGEDETHIDRKVDKSDHFEAGKGIDHEIGKNVEFEDLSNPDVRFGKGHAFKRASLMIEGTNQSMFLSGEDTGVVGRQGVAVMNMVAAVSPPKRLVCLFFSSPFLYPKSIAPPLSLCITTTSLLFFLSPHPSLFFSLPSPCRLSVAPRRGSAVSAPPTSVPFSSSSGAADADSSTYNPVTTSSSTSDSDGFLAPPAERRSMTGGARLSIKDLAAMKARKSVTGGSAGTEEL